MILPGITTSAKREFLLGLHRQEHIYKLALYTKDATLGPLTTGYGPHDEARGEGYAPGGEPLLGFASGAADSRAWLSWTRSVVWPDCTVTARGALVYNDSLPGKPALLVLDFGEDRTAVNGPFTVVMPEAAPDTALIVLE